jgi:hypothetical protein
MKRHIPSQLEEVLGQPMRLPATLCGATALEPA